MHGQGGWKGWDNDPTWTAYVTSAESRSTPHSVDVKGDTDLVHEYDGYTSGYFIYTAWQYLPTVTGDPPGAPVIGGPTDGDAGTTYDYTFNAVDPDGDDVRYYITWGDALTDWTDFGASGTDVIESHAWDSAGTYTITAYAEDSNGMAGPESTYVVTMPRGIISINTMFLRLLEKFPNAFPLIRHLLGL